MDNARESLTTHAAARGAELRLKFGPEIGWDQLLQILSDRTCVRYPCKLDFDAAALEPGECAYPEPLGERPEDGFRLCIHPWFAARRDCVPLLALYQIAAVNYGLFASPGDAEAFGAAVLGLPREQYYSELCALADELHADFPSEDGPGCGCSG